MTRRAERRRPFAPATIAAAITLTVVAAVAGCGSRDLTDATAADLQGQVLTVSTASAAGDLPAARTALDELSSAVTSAAARGDLTAERQGVVEAAITAVAADLADLEAQAAEATAEAEAAATAAAAAEQAAAEQAAAEKEAADQAAADEEEDRPGPEQKGPKDKDD
ncbi:hypothetical protein [Pengzhenrongella sicca]|uniref:Mucin-associated surface protein n=1 Tax=Pengzhenrongella sicca TaxID=2819238 RepID=A0A8A4ZBQ9_9MICO|nr:hypothetical protein [Pengzhenrongella sicca]QTE28439.1 hypothetical protein J4E96_13775 [Pengzhenrongella sicca]